MLNLGDTMKRYRLKIPEMISRDDADVAYHLQQSGSCEFEDRNGMLVCSQFSFLKRKVPKDWLEEIKACSKCGKDVSNGDWDWLDDWRKERICESCFNEEIKDEPMSDEDSINGAIRELESVFGTEAHGFRSEVWSIISRVIKNQKLRHRATPQAYEKWWANAPISTYGPYDYAYQAWQASKKAHNLPEEE